MGLPFHIHNAGNNSKKPVMIITWAGQEPQLPSVMLNSHMDVVPVYPEFWKHPPFGAEIDVDGKIYARGTQDMKSVGMQYLAAIRRLQKGGVTLKRTIHVIFVPDEEIAGSTGMENFVKSDVFRELNIGFALDEGCPVSDEKFLAFYAERTIWEMNFIISGTAGHGSLLLNNTTGAKLQYLLDKLMQYRQHELQRLEEDSSLYIGDVTSINLTQIRGGVQNNVVPPTIVASFDMRIAVDVDLNMLKKQLLQWCEEAGGDIEIEWTQNVSAAEPTKTDASNPFWVALTTGFQELDIKVEPHVFVAGTDIQSVRKLGIPAIGFSPINNTPFLAHDHDEFLTVNTYLRGIHIYAILLQKIANA